MQSRGIKACWAMGFMICAAAAACSVDDPDEPAAPGWEAFRQQAERVVDGQTIYVVEWDRALTLDQLRDYYEQYVAHPGFGVAGEALTVNQVNSQDDVWPSGGQLRLTYCVTDDFGARKARAVGEMAAATHAWEAAGNVSFRYVPEHDGSCSNANASVSFAVRPWSSSGACAFFPSGGGCVARTIVINYDNLDNDPFYADNAPNVETVGVFRHELGHVLGLRHEHIRPKAGGCSEGGAWRTVTDYDRQSVMHYPWCNGVITSDLSITSLDRQGIQLLYPFDFSSGRDPDEEVDLDGDGRADVCGRGAAGIYCALSTGAGFAPATLWTASFGDADGWNGGPEYYSTVRFPDVNGDGRADVCARGGGGIYCAPSTGASFGPVTLWASSFSDASGWAGGPEYYSTIRFPDVNGDGRADVCGRGGAGIFCAASTGTSFGSVNLWVSNFADWNGWNGGPEYWSTIRFPDVNGDGRADVCGRGGAGIFCAASTGTSFGAFDLWVNDFSDNNGWNAGPQLYATILFADVTGDGRADVCGRGTLGIHCAASTGTSFGAASLWETHFSDAAGWNGGPQYYSTIRLADVTGDGRADVCGRGGGGISCAPSTGTSFAPLNLWTTSYGDSTSWNGGPQYYSTVRLP